MMPDISLNVLDVAENSVRAKASRIEITVTADSVKDTLTIVIADNGCGMSPEMVERVTDPFFTTRKTRRVGLGVPFFKMAAEMSGGSFSIKSEVGIGTTVTAVFGLSHMDRMPLGDMASTMHQLITMHEEISYCYRYRYDDDSFELDTDAFREILGDVSFAEPEVSSYIREYLAENSAEVTAGRAI